MRLLFIVFAVLSLLFFSSCNSKKSSTVSYPEKFEGLTQMVLASETKTFVISDTTVSKVLFFKIGSAQVRVTASVTFDFYMDFAKDGYDLKYSINHDTLIFNAPPLKVKRPVLNGTTVEYPEKSLFINEDHEAVEKLSGLTDELVDDGESLLKEDYVIAKCREMLAEYVKGLSKKMGYPVTYVKIKIP